MGSKMNTSIGRFPTPKPTDRPKHKIVNTSIGWILMQNNVTLRGSQAGIYIFFDNVFFSSLRKNSVSLHISQFFHLGCIRLF